MGLEKFFTENPSTAVAFSGGADSAYVLYAAKRWGRKTAAYYVKTAFQPEFELRDAMRLAAQLDLPLTVIELDILKEKYIAQNHPDRCYYCKYRMLSAIIECAGEHGYTTVLDGTNASDPADLRPGMRALTELEIKSPLRISGLTKEEVRRLSRDAGLFTWDKPAYACLATRIPTGEEITADMLNRIEKTENRLFDMGFTDFRARLVNGGALLQFACEQMEKAFSQRQEICNEINRYFDNVYFDSKGR